MSNANSCANQDQGKKIFIVHGHDEFALQDVRDYVSGLGLVPIILNEQPSRGRTIIERIEDFKDVSFAIIMYTPCDIGKSAKSSGKCQYRARQNVVFEHGYFTGLLGRDKVAFLVMKDVERPSDTDGLLYIPFSTNNHWKNKLKKELLEASVITVEKEQ